MADVSLLGTGVSSPVTAIAASLAKPVAPTATDPNITWAVNALNRRLANMMAAAHWLYIYNPEVPLYDASARRSGAVVYTGPNGLPWNTEGRNFQAGTPINGVVASDRLFAVANYMSDVTPPTTRDAGGVTLTRCWEYERNGFYGEDFLVPIAALTSTGYTASLTSFWTAMAALPIMLAADADVAEQFAKAVLRGPILNAGRAQGLLAMAGQAKAFANQLAGRRAAMSPLPLVGRRFMAASWDAAVTEAIDASTKVAASLR